MAIKKVNDASLTSVANAIRTKGGTSANLYFPDGFVDAIEAIPTGGDTFADMYLTLYPSQSYSNSTATLIKSGAFAWTGVQSVSVPNATTMESYAFYKSNVRTVNLPKVGRIEQQTFLDNKYLETTDFSEVTTIFDYGFRGVSEYITGGIILNFPKLNSIGSNAFESANVKKINCPNLTSVSSYAFRYSKLEEFTFPSTCTSLNHSMFYNCTALRKVVFENDLTAVPANEFYGCTALEEVDLSHCSQIPTLPNISVFSGVPSTCVIKVPAALETEWKQATNWANFASQIQGV